MAKHEVRITQAVWERMTVLVDVPDGLEGEELDEALREKLDGCDYAEIDTRILDSLPSHDIEYERMDKMDEWVRL